MSSWRRLVATAAALALTACAYTLDRPVDPFESEVIEVAPNAWYESCVSLEAGDKLMFSYVVDPPMSFALRRHFGESNISYVVRDFAREEAGIFFVPESSEYCMRWTPPGSESPWPTLLRYSLRLNNR